MKTVAVISLFLLLLTSCHSSDDNTKVLLNNPDREIKSTESDETFTVDFGYDASIKQHIDYNVLPETFAKLKTRDDLIDFYKSSRPVFLPGYSSMTDNNESVFVKVEYRLAQECFSDSCDSETRKEVLQLVVDKQKNKFEEYTMPYHTRRTGVFLMAVILVKERAGSAKYIDTETLQKALLCLNSEIIPIITEYFSNSIVKSAENFLTNTKR